MGARNVQSVSVWETIWIFSYFLFRSKNISVLIWVNQILLLKIKKGCQAGLNFAFETEAYLFYEKVIDKVNKCNEKYEIDKYVSDFPVFFKPWSL